MRTAAILWLLLAVGCDRLLGLATVNPACEVDACEAAGGTCASNGVCVLTCMDSSCVCPEDLSCQLDVRAMATIVDCSGAVDCLVRCLDAGGGDGYCRDTEIRCGSGICQVSCTAEQFSCTGLTLLCGAGPCSLNCAQLGSCQEGSTVSCGQATECSTRCGTETCSSISVSCGQADVCTASCDPDGNNTCNNGSLSCEQASSCDLDCGGRPGCSSS